jgi:hypothetical protein
MPGFFKFMGRLMAGKPIYDPNDQPTGQPSMNAPGGPLPGQPQVPPQAQAPASPIHKGDASTFPVVEVQRVVTHVSGNAMQVGCWLCNRSPMQIILDRFRLLGGEIRLTDDLRPNQAHEYIVYRGPLLRNRESDVAVLHYRTASGGDYFEATYDLVFRYDGNSQTYTVDEMRLHPPIRDIYG